MSATTRAAVYRGRGRLDVTEVDLPAVGPSDVLVEVAYCGVCGTDLHNVIDGWGIPDSIGGHEWSGHVGCRRRRPDRGRHARRGFGPLAVR